MEAFLKSGMNVLDSLFKDKKVLFLLEACFYDVVAYVALGNARLRLVYNMTLDPT